MNPNDYDTAGKRLRYIREGIGLTRDAFAEIVGLSTRRLRGLESDEWELQQSDFEAICGQFPWAANWLTHGGPLTNGVFGMPGLTAEQIKKLTMNLVDLDMTQSMVAEPGAQYGKKDK